MTIRGFDTNTKLNLQSAQTLKNAGYDVCFRYLSLTQSDPNDLTTDELSNILRVGLKVGLVQHVRYPNWIPTIEMAKQDAQNAVTQLKNLNIPSGTTVFCDIEGIKYGTNKQDIINYINTWAEIIIQAGYEPGMYVGYNSYLTDSELYYALKVSKYWKSGSNVPTPVMRGYCIYQSTPSKTIAGIPIDEDKIQPDMKGELPKFVEPISTTSKIVVKSYTINIYNDNSIEVK